MNYTPKHETRLIMADIIIGVMARTCLDCRIVSVRGGEVTPYFEWNNKIPKAIN
jgi:hypothetical protein